MLIAKVALQFELAANTNVLVDAAPPQAPDQLVKFDPVFAAAVSVTDVLWVKLPAHAKPQLIPAGTDETLPAPVPPLEPADLYGST